MDDADTAARTLESPSDSASPKPLFVDDWPMFHHDPRHTGYSTSTAPSTNHILWSYPTGDDVASSPAVAYGNVYIGSDDGKVYCIDARTSVLVWSYPTGGMVRSSPAVANGWVYVGSNDGWLYCLDASTGTLVWSHAMAPYGLSSPTVSYGEVYVGSSSGWLYCLDAVTGAPIWSVLIGSPVTTSPAVADGKVFVGANDGWLYCLDTSTGTTGWSVKISDDPVYSSPTVAHGNVYVGSYAGLWYGHVYCLDASTGALVWSNPTEDPVFETSPAVAYGNVYVSDGSRVYCWDAVTGALIWGPRYLGFGLSSPAVADGKVFVGYATEPPAMSMDASVGNERPALVDFGGFVDCLDAWTGASIWSHTTGSPYYWPGSSPAVADGKVFVGANDGRVYCFGAATAVDDWPMFHHDPCHTGYSTSTAPSTNHILWSYPTDGYVFSSPAVADGNVYVGSYDGKVYCLSASTGAVRWSYTTDEWAVESSPTVVDGRVYVGSGAPSSFYCLDALTGALIWSDPTCGPVYGGSAVAYGNVYFVTDPWPSGYTLHCLDALTGTPVWSDDIWYVYSSPAVAYGNVYIGSAVPSGGTVYCLDALTGDLVWDYPTAQPVLASPAVAYGNVYVGSGDSFSPDGWVYCLDALTGTLVWGHPTGGFPVQSSPAVAYGNVYIGSGLGLHDGKVDCLNAWTGTSIWSYPTGGGVYSSPAVADGRVYVGSFDRKVYCLDALTGIAVWNYPTGGWVRSSPAVAYGNVYIGSNDGSVYCFGPEPRGPRTARIDIQHFVTMEAAYAALIAGDIDFIGGPGYSPALFPAGTLDAGGYLTDALFSAASSDSNIVIAPVAALNMYQFDLNNNYSIPAYPGIRSPMNYTELRQTIAYLADKDYYVDFLHGGKAHRIDQPLPAPLSGWASPNASWPYEYSPAAAKTLLDSRFPVGTTPNPYYNPADPVSSPYLRHYPDDHPQNAGQDLDPLIFYVRADHNARLMAGRMVYQALQSLGVPIEAHEVTGGVSYTPVMTEFNYHFYTGAWTTWKFPTHVYPQYHSTFAYPGGPNYVTGPSTHPQLDQYLADVYYAPTYDDTVAACQLAMDEFTRECVSVPLWSDASYCAWSTKLLGVVNMNGYGIMNPYTFLNAYKTDGSSVRCGLVGDSIALNTLYSGWGCDLVVLDLMNVYSGFDIPPYDLSADQPGFVADWKTTTWIDGNETKTMVRLALDIDAIFVAPWCCNLATRLNIRHLFWNAWLSYHAGDGWFWPSFKDLHHINMTSSYTCEIYFDTLSYWHSYAATGPLRPVDTWMAQGDTFIANITETVAIETVPLPEAPLPIDLTHDPIWIASVTFTNGTGSYPIPCINDPDYPCYIILGDFYVNPAYAGIGNYTVTYSYVASATALRGFTPGNLPWQIIFEGAGPYYCTAFTPGASITLERNSYYYMETPRLGEVDFVRKPNGAHRIDIFDVVKAAGAYGSQGIGVPSTNWCPGADVAPEAGKIDIFDIVTITSKYGEEWDHPS
jgi:outer membrane protein assembly factor BamB